VIMLALLLWYFLITVMGWVVWPMVYRLLPGLPDRGYAFTRALGLLLTGYVFWLLTSLGLLQNTAGGILFALLIVGGIALWVQRTQREGPRLLEWMRDQRGVVIVVEVLFFLAFAAWAVVRAYNPEIENTEKPMELAFLNGIRSSEVFPPRDPWLAGYAISYYYFGYVLISLLATLTAVPTGVAFNLGIALLFALTCLGAYGLVYNLVRARRSGGSASPALTALLGPLFVAVLGNLEGLAEALYSLNLMLARFWAWLDIPDLNTPVAGPVSWPPTRAGWWWWRASRVIHDRDIAGISIGLQPIDEFPFFSFLLGDMHPHVLVLPFVLLALGLAFNALRQRDPLNLPQVALMTVIFGGLAFLNTWDLPIYFFVLAGALVLRRVGEGGSLDFSRLIRPIGTALLILITGLAAYLPWLISFGSQAGGILPNPFFPTRIQQFFVMFGPFLIILIWFLLNQARQQHFRLDWGSGLLVGIGLLVTLAAIMLLMSAVALRRVPEVPAILVSNVGLLLPGMSAEEIAALVPLATQRVIQHRLTYPITALFLTALLSVTVSILIPRSAPDDEAQGNRLDDSTAFVLWMILTGALLTLGPEFVYLRDNFQQRLNTIFKFYYATWILWGVASAYAAHVIFENSGRIRRAAFAITLVVLLFAGLIYPALAIPNKTGIFNRSALDVPPTLDGLAFVQRRAPADFAAIQWLKQNAEPDAIILEAVGGAYSSYGRVSAMTGLQTVIGWANHERQWRGERYDEFAGGREESVREIYNTNSITRAMDLLHQYNVTYVFVGSLERSPEFATPSGLHKFDQYLSAVYRSEGVAIYRVDQPLVEEAP